MTKKKSRKKIPRPLAREVRQRCGFGCVICGMPLYEIDHIIDWAKTKHHKKEELTLLCNQHHAEKTKGLLEKEQVIEANNNPFNLRQGISKPYDLHFNGKNMDIIVGGIRCSMLKPIDGSKLKVICVDYHELLGFTIEDNHVYITLHLYDKQKNHLLSIVENRLQYSTIPWDIEFVGRNLIIRERHRNIILDVIFDPPNLITINRAKFYSNGIEINIEPDMVNISDHISIQAAAMGTAGAGIIFNLGKQIDMPSAATFKYINRYYWR